MNETIPNKPEEAAFLTHSKKLSRKNNEIWAVGNKFVTFQICNSNISMNSKQVIQLLERAGWVVKEQKGSHRQYVHPTKKGKVTVAFHGKKEIPPKTLKSIFIQAGLK